MLPRPIFSAPPDLPDGWAKRISMDTRFCSISYSADRIVRASPSVVYFVATEAEFLKPPVQEMLP